jgi:hypothetical protein
MDFIVGVTASRPSNPLRTNREQLSLGGFWCTDPR